MNTKTFFIVAMTILSTASGTFSCSDKPVQPSLSVEPSELSFTATGDESYDVMVTTDQQSWKVTSSRTWCTVTKKGTSRFTVTAAANTTSSERTATIVVSADDADKVTVKVTQDVEPRLSVSPDTPISFTKNGGTNEAKTITVATNQSSWDATSDQTWCTVKKETNQFTVTATAHSGASNRTATITVTAGKAPKITLPVTQVSEPNIAFVARNPVTEGLYRNGFFYGSRVNFALIVYEAAGMTSITINEEAKGAPNGRSGVIKQTRVIPISDAGTYPLSQEMWNEYVYGADIYQFTYTVSAHGKSYTRTYSGNYNAYNGTWIHSFGLK